MQAIINITLALLEGFALIISPCILPILPIILSSSLPGNKFKPIGLVLGFLTSFSIFTFFARKLIILSGIDFEIIRNVSLLLLVFLGIIIFSDYLSNKFAVISQRFININYTFSNRSEFINGFALGLIIGLIWTPCAGPILAAVIVQTVLETSNVVSYLIMLAFIIGLGIPLLILGLLGNRIYNSLSFFKKHNHIFRKILGILIILSSILVYYSTFPAAVDAKKLKNINQNRLIKPLLMPYSAPQLQGITGWLNSEPLNLKNLHGAVVLIDFWTYSCINCIRTLPYLTHWYDKYKNKGFIIIGVHSPEFEFEKNPDNVARAISKYKILYPVALDNNFSTWRAYNNRYWPAHYLINKEGKVVYQHFGEGNYDVTENNIRFLLGLNEPVNMDMNEPIINIRLTPEIYLGYARQEGFVNNEPPYKDNSYFYTYPGKLQQNQWTLQGLFKIQADKIVALEQQSFIKLSFYAKNVYAVMGSTDGTTKTIEILLNEKPYKTLQVNKHELYELINLERETQSELTIIIKDPGVEFYTFTFG